MSETPDISAAQTIPAIAAVPPDPNLLGTQMDFGSLIDDLDDPDLTPMPPLARPRRRRRFLAWLIVALLVVLIGGGILALLRTSRSTPVQYTQATVTTGNLTVSVAGSGPVVPHAVYNLNFSASAPITAIYVKVGDRVSKGQKLAALDETTLQDAINQAQDTVNSAANSLSQARTNLTNVQTQQATVLNIARLNEQKALSACVPPPTPTPAPAPSSTATVTPTPTPIVDTDATETAESNCEQLARQQYSQAQQQANAAITSASNQVTSAQQQLNNAQTALNTAKDNLKNAILLAPHAGLVETINGLVGETASGGSSSASGTGSSSSSAFIVLIDDSSLSIQAAVSEADIATIQVNQPATFTVAAYPSQTFRASVISLNTLGATSSNVVTYTVDLGIDLQSLNGARIYSGMTATTSITTAERISTLLIPSSALTFSTTALQNGEITRSQLNGLSSGGSTSTAAGTRGIVIELKAGKLVPVLVTTGLTNGQQSEILSGLQEGDEVVISQSGGTSSSSSSNSNSRNGGAGGGGGGGITLPRGGN
ncbi:MAG TPA: efflux RND transporter periplasmic adaptor subunit [Ktedonobacteraceae bacterium]